MSEPINNGGLAFPLSGGQYLGEDRATGMSLRDYFAAQALTGVLQARALLNGPDSLGSQEDVAEECYELADAMIAQRDGTVSVGADAHDLRVALRERAELRELVRAWVNDADAALAEAEGRT